MQQSRGVRLRSEKFYGVLRVAFMGLDVGLILIRVFNGCEEYLKFTTAKLGLRENCNNVVSDDA